MEIQTQQGAIPIPNFDLSDFDCPCCGFNNLDDLFLLKLQFARTEARIPFVINSGCRCEKHNKKVGGKKTSDHLEGKGADIKCTTSLQRWKIISSAINAGFRRIGIAKTCIHLGDRATNPQQVIWLY